MPDPSALLSGSAPFVIAVAVFVAALSRFGALAWLAGKPALMLGLGVLAGVAVRLTDLPEASPGSVRDAARFGLGLLAFTAAQQCRLSRLPRVSPAALRLAMLAGPGLVLVAAAAVFALLPDLGFWSALLVGVTLPLGVGAFDERLALAAPLSAETKRAVRVDAALGVALGIPLAVLVEGISIAPPAGGDATEFAGFGLFAGAAVGGTIGLLAGRLVPLRDASIPVAPFAAFLLSYVGAVLLGFDAVMAAAVCGLLYAEEAPLLGPVRARLFSAGARWCGPPAFFALGFLMGPTVIGADLLVWLAALVPVLALRVALRGAALGGAELPPADRAFLSWFGGVPGAGAALFLLSLLGSPSGAAQPGVLIVGALATAAGLVAARVGSGPLVTRQIRAAARARRKRYGAA